MARYDDFQSIPKEKLFCDLVKENLSPSFCMEMSSTGNCLMSIKYIIIDMYKPNKDDSISKD